MERSHPLHSHSTELYCQRQSIRYIDHASSAVKCRLWSPLLEVLCKRNLMRNCQQRTGKQINGTQQCSQGRDTHTYTSLPSYKPWVELQFQSEALSGFGFGIKRELKQTCSPPILGNWFIFGGSISLTFLEIHLFALLYSRWVLDEKTCTSFYLCTLRIR